jgi:AcrR family transcriptional regulator
MSAVIARRGRPRAFDRDKALRAAQAAIWRHGYEAMSLSQLESVMGIGKTSLYAAFGSKFDLLREAADLYIAEAGSLIAGILEGAPSALDGIERFLGRCAVDFTDPTRPYGCFLVSAAVTCSPENAEAELFLREGRAAVARLISARLARGAAEGDIRADAPVDALGEYVVTLLHGMSIQARDGRPRAALEESAALAMQTLRAYGVRR